MAAPRVALVAFDWAGTLIDHGSLAPVDAFSQVFAAHGIAVSTAEARIPMGLGKREHIEALLALPPIAKQWRARFDRAPSAEDVQRLYDDFRPAQLAAIEAHGVLIEGAAETVAVLRERGIHVASTTGYFREAADAVRALAAAQGLFVEHAVCADDVILSRPAPYMLFAC